MRNGNFWEFDDRPIPQAFYRGTTGLPPIDDAIRHALETGYCHHIERLMLLGNVMLLCIIRTKSTPGSWSCSWMPTTG